MDLNSKMDNFSHESQKKEDNPFTKAKKKEHPPLAVKNFRFGFEYIISDMKIIHKSEKNQIIHLRPSGAFWSQEVPSVGLTGLFVLLHDMYWLFVLLN